MKNKKDKQKKLSKSKNQQNGTHKNIFLDNENSSSGDDISVINISTSKDLSFNFDQGIKIASGLNIASNLGFGQKIITEANVPDIVPKARKKSEQKKAEITISLCMIVKNEEKYLPGCLESIKGLVDEIIIVDTGSTDKTIEIAESFNAKIFHFP